MHRIALELTETFCHFKQVVPANNDLKLRWRSGLLCLALLGLMLSAGACLAAESAGDGPVFPRPLSSYTAPEHAPLFEVLKARAQAEPFNVVATAIFLLAIIHTFLTPKFLRLSHHFEQKHQQRLARAGKLPPNGAPEEVSFPAKLFHFLGEIEAVFGIWVVPLLLALTLSQGWTTARDYLGHGLNFTEPLFVVVIMTMAASRPVLKLAEQVMGLAARLGRGSPAAWWLAILSLGPVLGSFITEPAAMTLCALLLAKKFYCCRPSAKLAYATLGLLFVNVSVGGTLTHFAAPPVLMVADKWHWGMAHMLTHFGWKAVVGIVAANGVYLACFWRELKRLQVGGPGSAAPCGSPEQEQAPPFWITLVHLSFLVWTVLNNHFPALFIGGFLFYLAFTQATEHHQDELALRPALLVGFFLAGLVVHGGLQGWWIQPVLSGLNDRSLFFGAAALTAFNDNAAITYLASLVPGFSAAAQYAVVAGAVAGGGLTVIANAPNPAGQSILARFFPEGISPLGLFLGALIPTALVSAAFLLLG